MVDQGLEGTQGRRVSSCPLLVPVHSRPQTEAIHLVIEHLLIHLLKEDLANGAQGEN
jgi:hypothetical protein